MNNKFKIGDKVKLKKLYDPGSYHQYEIISIHDFTLLDVRQLTGYLTGKLWLSNNSKFFELVIPVETKPLTPIEFISWLGGDRE